SAEGAAIAPFAWSPAAGQQKITLRNGEQNPAGLICGIPASASAADSAWSHRRGDYSAFIRHFYR
ncbi:hypothetical protein, partial [Tatumella sp. JGM91]|uniref:hypothetical protein n=1 Tax=Tatumella sp. JGM91 TaxID=2799794 RepID=UPI001BAF2E2A